MGHRRQSTPRRGLKEPGWFRRRALWGVLLVALAVLATFARSGYSVWARQAAIDRLQAGAISDACRFLRWAAWSAPDDGLIDMISAFCFRQLRQPELWKASLIAAEKKGVAREDLERETQLYRIQSGDWFEGAESRFSAFAGKGVTTYDVPAAFVQGCLASGRNGLAQQILDVWDSDFPNDPHVAYMRGKYWETMGDVQQARAQFEAAVTLEPRHEAARVSLAEFFEQNNRLQEAYRQYAGLAAASPASDVAVIGVARILRKMGHLDKAGTILKPLAFSTEASKRALREMGCIAMERGDLPQAERWFKCAGMQQTRDPEFLMSALRLMGLQGRPVEAERLYQRVAALGDRVTRIRDLRTKLALDPADGVSAAEITRLYQGLGAEMTSLENLPADSSVDGEGLLPGRRLYVAHCSVCHGPEGDGNGLAARHLFPLPRDLRWESSRLVGTTNGVPSLDDTMNVLRRGIPGTSMPSYASLDENELRLLADEVHRMRREGLPQRFVTMMESQGEAVGEDEMEEVEEAVELLTAPGDPIVVPSIGPATPASIARGKEAYLRLACATCHGEDGTGAADQFLYDERGFPTRPRDLAREPFKGGHETGSVYQRIVAGMPGSPHPACSDVSQESLVNLVQYCLSLSREPKRDLTDDQRAALATSRAYLATLRGK